MAPPSKIPSPAPKRTQLPDWQPRRPPLRPLTQKEKDAAKKKSDADFVRENEREDQERDKRWKENQNPAELTDRRTRCVAHLGYFKTEISKRKNNWENVATDVGLAYEKAFESFTKVLKESTHSQSHWNKAFEALSSLVGGGIAKLVKKHGDKWITEEAQKLFVESAENAMNAGVGKLFEAFVPLSVTGSAAEIPAPSLFQAELKKLLNNLESEMLGWVGKYETIMANVHFSAFENYDPQTLRDEIDQFLNDKDSTYNSQPFPFQGTKADLQIELEKMMLGPWTVAFCQREISRNRLAPRRQLPKAVIDRLVDFKFVSDSGHYSDADVLKIADWGPNTERTMRRTIEKIGAYRAKRFG